jgi:hypothetical protein
VKLNKYIPENLNVDELIKEFPPFFKMDRDKLLHIISLLNEIPAIDHSQYEKEDGWIPIHSTLVQKVGIRDFPKYKDWLIEVGILETDGRYIPNEKATYYRFKEKYRRPIKIESISKKTLLKAISKKSNNEMISQKSYPHLFKWFDGLQIDVDAAEDFLWQKYKLDKKQGILHSREKLNAGIINVDKIASGQIHFSVDQSAGRLHHNLSNMQSSLRNFMTYKGLPLVSIDIRNSQPAMCTAILQPKFWGLLTDEETTNSVDRSNSYQETKGEKNFEKIRDLEGNTSENFKKIGVFEGQSIVFNDFPSKFQQSIPNTTSPIMLAELHKTLAEPDVQKFIEVVSAGQLYEYMEEQIHEHNRSVSGEIKEYTRKDIKVIIFTVLFTDNRFIGQQSATPKRIFKSIFPNVYKILAMIKKTDKTMLAILLQKLESMVVLDRITKRIAKERPKLPIYTIHDSITTTVGNEEYVQNVMKEEIQKAIGIVPALSIEFWAPLQIAKTKNVA